MTSVVFPRTCGGKSGVLPLLRVSLLRPPRALAFTPPPTVDGVFKTPPTRAKR